MSIATYVLITCLLVCALLQIIVLRQRSSGSPRQIISGGANETSMAKLRQDMFCQDAPDVVKAGQS